MHSPTQLHVYTPDSELRRPRRLWRQMRRDLWASRELALRLAVRDIRAQYRQAALGFAWALILPLANTVTWIFLSASKLITVSTTVLPYPVFVFVGTLLWSIFMEAFTSPLQQTSAAKGMLAKINFPPEALIISGVYQTLFNAAIKFGILLLILPWLGINLGFGLLLAPLGLLAIVLMGTTLGLLVTPVGLLYGDVGRAMPLLLQFLMYLTPVVFPLPESGWGGTVMRLNPLTPLILTGRDWLTGQSPEFLGAFVGVNILAAGLLLVVWLVYRLAMPILIERMSA